MGKVAESFGKNRRKCFFRASDAMSDSSSRIGFLDVARGMGIVFVLLGHNLWSQSKGSAIIFNFHMPLFYFLSGIFFSAEKTKQAKDILYKVISIMLPVPLLAAIASLVFVADPSQLGQFSMRTFDTFIIHGEPWYDKPLWFFTSLAGVVLVFSLISRWFLERKRRLVVYRVAFLFVFLFLSIIMAKAPASFRKVWSPAMLATLPIGIFYYGLGYFTKGWIEKLKNIHADGGGGAFTLCLIAVANILITILMLTCDVATKPDVRTARLGSWLFFPRSLCGITAVILLARAIPAKVGIPLAFIGRYSIVFFALEFVTFPYLAKILCSIVPGYSHLKIAEDTQVWQSCLAVLGQIAVLAAISPIMAKMLLKWRSVADGTIEKWFVCK